MGILDDFDPKRDGWFFGNWTEATDFDWSLYRRTYLAINPTNDPVAAPLDSAFFEIFKSCAKQGNCGGMSMLALALFKYGGYMGFGSPARFYTGGGDGPDRTDLRQAMNIMQARQFSAPGIRNFVDLVNAGQLNDGFAAFDRIESGLGSGDYCMLSVSNGLFGDAAHTIMPYRAQQVGGTRVLHVYDPNRPYDDFPAYYDNDLNKIVITGPTSWTYDQTGGGTITVGGSVNGNIYQGSNNGWFFAIPTSLEIHKARHPISPGFVLTNAISLFVSSVGAESGQAATVTQIEDEDGRRLFTSDRVHRSRADLETSPDRRLTGVAPWPWPDRAGGEAPGELFFIQRPPGSTPLRVSVRGDDYRLTCLSADGLTELTAHPTGTPAKDRILLPGSADGEHAVAVSTRTAGRTVDLHHLRQEAPGAWRSVRVANAALAREPLQVRAPFGFEAVEISGASTARRVDVELRRYADGKVSTRRIPDQRVPAGRALRMAPSSWERLSRAKVEQALS